MDHPAVLGWRRLLLAAQRVHVLRGRDDESAQLREPARPARLRVTFGPEQDPANGSESPVPRGRRRNGPAVIPATLLQNTNIQEYLQAADHIALQSPLVARMLNVYAYEKAMEMDPQSEGRGVLQFKTSLHTLLWQQQRRGEHEERGVDAEDAAAFQEFCRAYRERLQELEKWPDQHREELLTAWKTAQVLTEVLQSLGERDPNIVSGELKREMADEAAAKTELLSKQRYNIVPLNVRDSTEPIMELAEVKAAVAAMEYTGDLPRQPGTNLPFPDVLEFLKFVFGFQTDSVHNQREHIVLLLANLMTRSHADMNQRMEEAVEELYDAVLANYKAWLLYLGLKDPYHSARGTWKVKLLFVSLYLLIWGEAANVRFVPECLCYIFHRMALEMVGMLSERDAQHSVLVTTPNSHYNFLHKIILPFYLVIKEEANYGGVGFDAKGHEEWRNYDDLNEFFWSNRCMELGWPLDLSQGFFTTPSSRQSSQVEKVAPANAVPTSLQELREEQAARGGKGRSQHSPVGRGPGSTSGGKRESKSLFVEWRTFWHVYHSFGRHWIFLFLMLQAMVIIAFSSPNKAHTIYKMLTLAPAAACFISLQAAVDVSLSWGAYRSMTWAMIGGKWLRLLVAIGWSAVLIFFAMKMLEEMTHSTKVWLGPNIILVAVYIFPRLAINILRRIAPLRTKVDRVNQWLFFRFLRWLYQEEYFVGRGMFESTRTSALYTAFWVVLFICKFLFSYYFMIQPLVVPTRYLADFVHLQYKWHDLVSAKHWNFLTLASIWSPVVIIYLLDTSIWYTVLSALGGGVIGAYWHLGEIRTLNMVRARFRSFPQEFMRKLQPVTNFDRTYSESARGANGQQEAMERKHADRFAIVWNEIIKSMREEDLLSNREQGLLLLPFNTGSLLVQWPLFLLANKVMLALGIAETHEENDRVLWKRICEDYFMCSAVTELYSSLRSMLLEITAGDNPRYDTNESRIVNAIFADLENAILQICFVSSFKLKKLRLLHGKLSELTAVLVQPQTEELTSKAAALLQTLYAVTTREFLDEDLRMRLEGSHSLQDARLRSTLFSRINWPNPERTRRLHQLLTIADSAKGVPRNLEARRRLQFFTNSLFMSMPEAPPVHKMVPFCVMTPYYSEIVKYSKDELTRENEDGISTLFYLQKIFPDEWENLSERINVKQSHVEASMGTDKEGKVVQEVRKWASYRGQTLARTVRGMMYYRRALRLLAYMESGREQDLEQGQRGDHPESAEEGYLRNSTRALADLKFTYVVTCQIYGAQKAANDARAADIFDLMKANEGLRVAYIDEVEVIHGEGRSRTTVKEYFSRLVKVDIFGEEQNVYRIKLPGPAKQGEGKPENQNHAIIFTRGDALQTIDMNQDNYLEEAMKVRNLLQEFRRRDGLRRPTILGVREHVFTGSVSSLAWFMSNQETSFVTLGQRFMASPLKVRMHYGHPDVFDRLFHITRGGISKASKTINISEDIFAGFNTTLRQGNVTHHEYIQVGKGRDVGLNQIALFEAKVASGNGEQMLSRDVYRLGQLFDFHRMLSFFHTSVGFYICTMLTVWCVYFFLYGKVYMALSGVEATLSSRTKTLGNKALTAALNTQFLLQIGIFTAVPMVVGFVLEQGFLQALVSFVTLQLQMASVFFTFSLGTRTHYFGRTILHGGAKYRSTGRGFVVRHEKFAENYRLFSRSHFVKGLEVVLLLIVYLVYGTSTTSSSYILLAFSSWFMAISWCFAPFIFNPSGFEWQKTVQDFEDWTTWLFYSGGIGMKGEQSWEAWWEEELSHIRTLRGRFLEVLLSLRFFLFQYGIAYQLHITNGSTSILIYAYSWVAIGGVLLLVWVSNLGRTWDVQWAVRLLQGSLFVASLLVVTLVIAFTALTISDVFACILGIIPTGWGLLQIAVALKPFFEWLGWWKRIRYLARLYDAGMGALIFFPVALLSWFPFVSTFQTRLVFNQAFSRGLEISLILAGNKANKND